jgi:hypothetical protein
MNLPKSEYGKHKMVHFFKHKTPRPVWTWLCREVGIQEPNGYYGIHLVENSLIHQKAEGYLLSWDYK